MPFYSPFWQDNYSLQNNKAPSETQISRLMRRINTRVLKTLMVGLNGAAAGGAVSNSRSRVQGIAGDMQGGVRPIESQSLINRNTAAADETRIDNILLQDFSPASYPTDASGNGGGNKIGS